MAPPTKDHRPPGRYDVPVKECPKCGALFSVRDLVRDKQASPVGMTADARDPQRSVFQFHHDRPDCGATFTIPVESFASLILEMMRRAVSAVVPACDAQCVSADDLAVCGKECSHAPYRLFFVEVLVPRGRFGRGPDVKRTS